VASRKARLGQYLEWHHGTIRVSLPVPKALQPIIGATRLKRTLGTDSPANAERIKHAVIHELKGLLTAAERPAEGVATEAMGWRKDIAAAPSRREREALEFLVHERAEELEAKSGRAMAREFVEIAQGRATPIDTLLQSYLDTCGLAPRTIDGIRRTVRVYREWAEANGEPTSIEHINRKVAGRFVTEHLLPRMAVQSAGTYTKFLGGYWSFLEGKGYVEASPWSGQFKGVGKARKKASVLLDNGTKGGKRPYTTEEARKLLYTKPEGPTDQRTLDLVWLGALSGMRIEELCGLRVQDSANDWFNVNADGKGKTEAAVRRVPIHPQLKAIVARRTSGKKPEEFLIDDLPEPPDGSIRERSMPASKAYTRFRRRLGVDERAEGQRQSNVDFHSWRRWFIREARDAGASLWTLADLVGHDTDSLPGGLTMGRYPGPASDKDLKTCVESVTLPDEAKAP